MNTEQLSRLAAALDEPTRLLDSRLRDAQLKLTELNLGVQAHVALRTNEKQRRTFLSWIFLNGSYGLYIRFEGDADPIRLLGAPRILRAAAARMLSMLFSELKSNLEKETQAVHTGIEEADTFLKTLEAT